MKWEMLTSILEKAVEKVNSLNDVDERMAMLVFYVAEMVEAEERAACAQIADGWSGHYQANEIAASIRARDQQ